MAGTQSPALAPKDSPLVFRVADDRYRLKGVIAMKTNGFHPSDKDLQALWNDMYWEPGKQSTPMIYRYARAVLERWGNIPNKSEISNISDW